MEADWDRDWGGLGWDWDFDLEDPRVGVGIGIWHGLAPIGVMGGCIESVHDMRFVYTHVCELK